MLNRRFITLLVVLSTGAFLTPLAHSAEIKNGQQHSEIIQIEVRKDIRVVYQVSSDEWKKGVGKAFVYLKSLSGLYDESAIPRQERHINAVFHGDAGYWMLTDDAYNTHTKTTAGNPNKAIIRELVEMGVSIELCNQTMKSEGWSSEDVLPTVKIVIGAYPRIIDLQMQGYAYIKF